MTTDADEQREQILALHIAGRSQREISEATGLGLATVNRRLHTPEAQHALQAAADEATRARERRISRHREPKETVVTPSPSEGSHSSKADGRLLGLLSFPQPFAALAGYTSPAARIHAGGDFLETQSYADWLDNRTRTRNLPPEPADVPCSVTTPHSSYTFFLDTEDIARIAAVLSEETGQPENALRTLLSETPPGGSLQLA